VHLPVSYWPSERIALDQQPDDGVRHLGRASKADRLDLSPAVKRWLLSETAKKLYKLNACTGGEFCSWASPTFPRMAWETERSEGEGGSRLDVPLIHDGESSSLLHNKAQ